MLFFYCINIHIIVYPSYSYIGEKFTFHKYADIFIFYLNIKHMSEGKIIYAPLHRAGFREKIRWVHSLHNHIFKHNLIFIEERKVNV